MDEGHEPADNRHFLILFISRAHAAAETTFTLLLDLQQQKLKGYIKLRCSTSNDLKSTTVEIKRVYKSDQHLEESETIYNSRN